jgi:outer membrane protein TolC
MNQITQIRLLLAETESTISAYQQTRDYAIKKLAEVLDKPSDSLLDLVDEAVRRLTPAPPVDPYAGHPELPLTTDTTEA